MRVPGISILSRATPEAINRSRIISGRILSGDIALFLQNIRRSCSAISFALAIVYDIPTKGGDR
jgi:hypothetical protein